MKPLRKRHLQVWTLLAVLIPVGIISGYLAIPEETTNKLLQEDNTAALHLVINKIDRKNYSVYLRSSSNKNNFQLQWVNTKGSTAPSSLIYKIRNAEKELIGRVESQGSYYFPLKADSTGTYNFILYDVIHRQTIDTLNFKQ
jgi:hypothetical protein